jgi:hypothetical protein
MRLDQDKLKAYQEWAAARLAAATIEDPRDVPAFVQHLRNLGADWRRPHDYGLPDVPPDGWQLPGGALDRSKLKACHEWAAARLAVDQDPRDVPAFIQHLHDLGADAHQPHDFGLPAATHQAPRVVWVGSPNFWPGRPAGPPIAICIHTMAGTLAGSDSWFQQTADEQKRVSAHFGVGLDGTIHQYVRLDDRAWANGVLEPGNRWFGPAGVSPNSLTVSVETEDRNDPDQPVTDAQWDATLAVCREVTEAYPTVTRLISHHLISPGSRPGCCGNRWIASGRLASLAGALGLELRI